MLSLKDCMDYCDLDCSEIEAVAEHEHLPFLLALELSSNLLETPEGVRDLHRMVREDIEHALELGEADRATRLTATYLHLKATHPLPPEGT